MCLIKYLKSKKTKKIYASDSRNMHLIVDNMVSCRILLAAILDKIGEKNMQCCNGKEALKFASEKNFSFIWIDVNMPVMNGIDATIELRKIGYKGHIIGVTGQNDKSTYNICIKSGMDHVIVKPISLKNICDTIEYFNSSSEKID